MHPGYGYYAGSGRNFFLKKIPRQGEIMVGFPTETVYGLGADAFTAGRGENEFMQQKGVRQTIQ